MRLRGREKLFHRMEIRTEAANVAETNIEKVGGGIEIPVRSEKKRGVSSGISESLRYMNNIEL